MFSFFQHVRYHVTCTGGKKIQDSYMRAIMSSTSIWKKFPSFALHSPCAWVGFFLLFSFPSLSFFSTWDLYCDNVVGHYDFAVGHLTKLFGSDDTNEDRMISLRKHAEVDSKNLIIFVPDDPLELKQSLNRYSTLIMFLLDFLALTFYIL